MTGKGRPQRELEASKKKKMMESSSDEEDSDAERNFALISERSQGGGGGEQDQEEISEDEEGSDAGKEEEEEGEEGEGSDASEEEDEEEEDGDSEASEEEEEEEPVVAGGSGEIQTREDIKNELSSMSFEDLMKLQNQVGTKVYNQVAYGDGHRRAESGTKRRLNKNRPMEISAKRPPPLIRQVVPVKKSTLRDPRFDDLSGEYKPEIFEKTYKFINDIRHREKEILQKKLKKTKSSERKETLQFLLKRMENQERARQSQEKQRERELQFKRLQRERANQGARPFFLKSSEKKKLLLAEKYQDLKKSGKLENFLSKKRKRNAGKDRRKLPKPSAV
ncbi:ribosomal RNA processing protein 36 homolog [Halichoeres trimaculatus]|uniref:ribosomal RNA processing protein 36 homolog n=1 Tax=Halichoeres trimaculatus TaxID=147232 RepID=UPI003D9F6597